MTRIISRAESFETVYEAFSKVNFNSFDFNSIKESMIEYIKLYFPEDFNDFIESSELIAILEIFAYLGELLAYRIDLNAHENFLSTAQRKESVLRLAKLVSYAPTRNIPARGLAKLTSIQTSETLFDSASRNLANRKILWNDPNNPNWKEQFILIMNTVLQQEFGDVRPEERVQVDDVLFELYTWDNNPLNPGGASVFTYSVNVSGNSYAMELVPAELTVAGPTEKRPENDSTFTFLYASDGLGDASDTTGFMVYTKQGTLQKQTKTFDGVTPNQTLDISINNINDTDVFLNNINANTGQILTEDPFADIPTLAAETTYGEWVEVDIANAQNIIFNTNENRRKFEIETLADDQIRIIFGDGEFAAIPNGTFDIWFRTSENADVVITQNAVVNQQQSFTYQDINGNTQTLTFQFSLISSLQNNSSSETIEHIRRVAPSVYYTQDRMVNGRDYNTFLLQDPSIIKLRAINRTFAGDSKYIAWNDPSGSYDNIKLFGDDLALYFFDSDANAAPVNISNIVDPNIILQIFIEPMLSSTDFFLALSESMIAAGKTPGSLRKTFNNLPLSFAPTIGETDDIISNLTPINSTGIDLYYSAVYDEWTVGAHSFDSVPLVTDPLFPAYVAEGSKGAANSIKMVHVAHTSTDEWIISGKRFRLIAHSNTTQFWNLNSADSIVNFDTLNPNLDKIVVLKANINSDETGLLSKNINFLILGQEKESSSIPTTGLPNINTLSVISEDVNQDGIADDVVLPDLFDKQSSAITVGSPGNIIQLERSVIISTASPVPVSHEDIIVYHGTDPLEYGTEWIESFTSGDVITDEIQILIPLSGSPVQEISIVYKDYVYLFRNTITDPWQVIEPTNDNKVAYASDTDNSNYLRFRGKNGFNFAWFHATAKYHLIDPAFTNIIDIFVVTNGYYTSLRRWISGREDTKPVAPTSVELKNAYQNLLFNKMISDTVIMHSGEFKILFGSKADPELRATFKVIRSPGNTTLTDNQIKAQIVEIIESFFDINFWEYGETFYFTELATVIHTKLSSAIDSIVLVPTFPQNVFGDLFQVQATENELFLPDITTSNIEIVTSYNSINLRQ